MSSLLRSSKFIRYLALSTRSLITSNARPTPGIPHLTNFNDVTSHVRFLSATAAPTPTPNSNLEKSLQQLDQDVRRMGRISRRDIEEVLEEIRHSRTATSSQSLLVIRCCGNLVPEELPEVRTKLVQEIWSTLESLKVPMDVSHYNALLRVYLENEHNFSPAEFLQDLERKGVEPNRVTYQRLVTRYCQQGDIEGATRILEFMREKNLPVNESVFNALVMGHSQAEDMDSATGILHVMKQAGLEPSADTYTTLLVGHAKKGEIDKIESIFHECDQKDVYLLDKDHLDIVFALATNGHADKIDMVLNRIRKSAGFNQDAVNLILRLVNHGQEEVAFKVLRLMPKPMRDNSEHSMNQGMFFVRQLVKANRPVDSIVAICEKLQSEGMNNKSFTTALEAALSEGNTDLSFKLMNTLQASGFPIKPHFFWPLLCNAGKARDDNLVASILQEMIEKFQITPNGETVREYVIPNITIGDHDHIVGFLKKVGVSSGVTASSLAFELLSDGRIAAAADVVSKYRAFYNPMLLRRALNNAYIRTNAASHYVNILHHIHEGLGRSPQGEELDSGALEQKDLVGSFLLDLLYAGQRKGVSLQPILQELLERGLVIDSESAEQIQSRLSGEQLTNEISDLLSKLTNTELETVPAKRTRIPNSAFPADEETINQRIDKLIANGQSAAFPQRALFMLHCKNLELEKADSLFKVLGENAGPGSYAIIIDAHKTAGNLDTALDYLKKFEAKYTDASLDPARIIRLANAFFEVDRIEDGIRILEESKMQRSVEEIPFALKAAAFQSLNILAEKKNVDIIEKVFSLLTTKYYAEVSSVLLGPLIKVHLLNEDVATALDKLDEFAEKYKMTPWKNEVAKRLIQSEDPVGLQRLTDISSRVHGEVNSLYDLVFAFVECGRVRQARKILETPGLRNRQQRLNAICERYEQEGAIASLEGLAEATRDMTHIDRTCIFGQLLNIHIKAGDDEKALGVWTQMQEEDIQASEEFLFKLATFLESKQIPVPFIKPAHAPKPPVEEAKVEKQEAGKKMRTQTPIHISLRNAIRNRNIEEAKKIKLELDQQNKPVSPNDLSLLLEALCQHNQISDATELALSTLRAGKKFLDRHLRYFSNKLSTAGDVETLKSIGKLIDSTSKKAISFDNKLCSAYINSGRHVEYIDELYKEATEAKPEDAVSLEEKFPRGAIGALIENKPELLPKFEQIVEKLHKLGSPSPANTLWMSHFLTPGMEERATQVWENYGLGRTSRLMFQRIIVKARETNDDVLLKKLEERLKNSSVSESALGLAFSSTIDVLVRKGCVDEALTRLSSYLQDISLENFSTTTLRKLKQAVETKGDTFPYNIPLSTPVPYDHKLPSVKSLEPIEDNRSIPFLVGMIGFNADCLNKANNENWRSFLKDEAGICDRVPFDPSAILNVHLPFRKKLKAQSSSSSSDDESEKKDKKE